MALSSMKPNQNIVHSYVVSAIKDKEKEFNSSEGVKRKYVIEFTNGYAAEYCPLKSVGPDPVIKEGHTLSFRIIHRKDWADEIVPYFHEAASSGNLVKEGQVASMGGHPAVSAINVAGQIYAAKIKTGADEDTYGITNMLEDADIIYNWLLDKAKKPQQ